MDLAMGATAHLSKLATGLNRLPPYAGPQAKLAPQRTDAEVMHEKLVKSIAEFEEQLDATQEVDACLVNFGLQPIHIDDVGFWGHDLIVFHGGNSVGAPVQLLQHISQVNVMLVAIPTTSPIPKRIGYAMVQKLKEQG
jgi:hypothetical protein